MLANLTDQMSVVVSTNRIVATIEVHNTRRVGVLTLSWVDFETEVDLKETQR